MTDTRKHHQREQGFQRNQETGFSVPTKDLETILDGKDPKKLVEIAEQIAKNITSGPPAKRVTTSQIRNIFGTVKSLESRGAVTDAVIGKLMLLKPKIAYAAGRHSEIPGMNVLKTVLSNAIDLVYEKGAVRFDHFCSFFEAILAYHKSYGGK